MPYHSSWGMTASQNRLPPTPPDYKGSYLSAGGAASEQSYHSHGFHGRHGSSRDHSNRYSQAYAAQRSMSAHAHPHMNHMSAMDFTYSVAPQYQYHAPILPPIRLGDSTDHYAYPRQDVKKEEKPTGGVAQHLDYEMALMSSFVAEMAQDLVNPGVSPSMQFRKYVSQILSSTRLPSSTIMLGLFYLSARMKIVHESDQDVSASGTVYRMLTTCLLLGSKFLDDNTFQNRSWAEVSSISVQELNTMELSWLQGFDWEIHSMFHKDSGLDKWIAHWHSYEKRAKAAKARELQKLTPIDTTTVRRNRSARQSVVLSPDGPIPPQYQTGPQYDTQWARPYISEHSPPSAPHSDPATPEYYPSWSYTQTPASYGPYANNSTYLTQHVQPQIYSHTATYPPYGHNHFAWSHGATCSCTLCAKHPDYYFTHSGYGVQTVVG